MEKRTKIIALVISIILLATGSFCYVQMANSTNLAPVGTTLVSTELINYYSMSTANIETVMGLLENQGISTLTLRINSYNEWSSNSNTAIAKIKTIIPIANEHGIDVNVDLHTWYTTWDNSFRDTASGSSSNRAQYLNYVETTLNAFDGYNVNAFMVLNEPQARTATTSENNFILSVLSTAHAATDKPVSVRFMGGYSPTTGHYAAAIDQSCDFLCRNSYWDARNPSTAVYGCTEAKILAVLNSAHDQGKQLWITEFGKNNNNLEDQRAYVEAWVSYAKEHDIDQIFCWVSQPSSSGESYNIFNGYTPNPAFYELVNDVVPTEAPTVMPTVPPTTTPSRPNFTTIDLGIVSASIPDSEKTYAFNVSVTVQGQMVNIPTTAIVPVEGMTAEKSISMIYRVFSEMTPVATDGYTLVSLNQTNNVWMEYKISLS